MSTWDEDGVAIQYINQIVKVKGEDQSEYALASEYGIHFIQITCKKVKGKNKFTFTRLDTPNLEDIITDGLNFITE